MTDLCEAAQNVSMPDHLCPTMNDALSIYLAINKPDLQTAISRYAAEHNISKSTAVAEACRAYFVGE